MDDDNKLNFELLPCPFCGSKEVEPLFMKWEEEWRVICNSCGAYTTFGYAEVSHWNARPIEDTLRAELAALKEQMRWIPVSERLPEDDTSVLIFIENETYYAAFAYGVFWEISDFALEGVTHWRPLPTPPEGA